MKGFKIVSRRLKLLDFLIDQMKFSERKSVMMNHVQKTPKFEDMP